VYIELKMYNIKEKRRLLQSLWTRWS